MDIFKKTMCNFVLMVRNCVLLIFLVLFSTARLMAQGQVIGRVINAETHEPMSSVVVEEVGVLPKVFTDDEGLFVLNLSRQTSKIAINAMGYSGVQKWVVVDAGKVVSIGTFELSAAKEDQLEVSGVVDVAKDRVTPVAKSTISLDDIQMKSGNLEFAELMKNTPSLYVSGQGGGFGDAKLFVRGFDQTNLALLYNGQPINGMEDGAIYWSNWQGLEEIANAVQIQRGLGSSKLAISSVGATINVITKATDLQQKGRASSTIGNDGYQRYSASYSSGVSEKGWGVSMLLSHWQGDGYNDGTQGQGQTYFISVGYEPNEKHAINLSLTGSPQWHNQNYTKTISSYDRNGDGKISNREQRFNDNWGYLNGDVYTWRKNFYHKPVLNFNWDWNINSKSTLSTVAYASSGRGGATGSYGDSDLATMKDENGQVDFDGIVEINKSVDSSFADYGIEGKVIGSSDNSIVRRSAMNVHRWQGIVSNYNHIINEHWSYNVGGDLRTYFGEHYRLLENLLGLDGYHELFSSADDPGAAQLYPGGITYTQEHESSPYYKIKYRNSVPDNKLDYHRNERISYLGAFGQVEYKNSKLSAFVQGALSTQSYQRFDYFMYSSPSDQVSEKLRHDGFNLKVGGNYNLSDKHNVFANAGYYSRQPYFESLFLNVKNEVNEEVGNESILGLELGYGFKSRFFEADVNVYRTQWSDRQIRKASGAVGNGVSNGLIFFQDVAELHTGVEAEFLARVTRFVSLSGFASFGDWRYVNDAVAQVYDADAIFLGEKYLYLDDVKVGGAPQFTCGFTSEWLLSRNWLVDVDYCRYGQFYATSSPKLFTTSDYEGTLKLPSYGLTDFGVSYRMCFKSENRLTVRANINNVFNKQYISQCDTNYLSADGDATWKGVKTSNWVFFGNGRTWNVALIFDF